MRDVPITVHVFLSNRRPTTTEKNDTNSEDESNRL